MDLANMRDICARQERILRFEKFDQETAWELGSLMVAEMTGEGVEECGLSSREYVFCGGGFPIRLKSGELVAVALASGLPDVQDHGFLIDCLAKYLDVEAPVIE